MFYYTFWHLIRFLLADPHNYSYIYVNIDTTSHTYQGYGLPILEKMYLPVRQMLLSVEYGKKDVTEARQRDSTASFSSLATAQVYQM